MWKKKVKPDRPQMTVWRKRFACWIPKAINTHSEYVTLTYFPLQQWLHERASMLRYTYTLPVLFYSGQPFLRSLVSQLLKVHVTFNGGKV